MPRPRAPHRRLIGRLGIVAAALVAAAVMSPAAAAPAPAGGVLPDLVADPATDTLLTTDAAGGQNRLLLRFAGYVHNAGLGALDMRGSRASTTTPMTVAQRIYGADGGFADVASGAQMTYEDGDGHHHWHLMHAARYSLWNEQRSAEVAPAMKVGFCLLDSERVETNGPANAVYGASLDHHFCEQGDPGRLTVFQGVSAGWRDVYHNRLAFQWVDVSSVQPGSYWLRSEVDPDNVIAEGAEANQAAWAGSASTIPGYVAQSVARTGLASGRPATVTLPAQRFGAPGPATYRIESAPAHGSLDVAAGTSRASPDVVYRSAPGFSGADTFTFSVRDATSPFPRAAAVATVTLNVAAAPAPAVQIAGPDSVVAGTSAQLTATVANDAPGVAWSADGVPGGNATVGTVSRSGLYTAPARPPARGVVTVAARSTSGARAERTMRIVPAPRPRPAPVPAWAVRGETRSRARARLTAPRADRLGRRLIITTIPRRSGVVRLSAFAGRRPLGSCAARTPAGRRFTCRLRIPRAVPVSARIRVVASLRVDGRVVAVRTRRAARVPAGHHHH